jgi:hypothetical protein
MKGEDTETYLRHVEIALDHRPNIISTMVAMWLPPWLKIVKSSFLT